MARPSANAAADRAGVSGQYETPPVFGDARLVFRADATWHSRRRNEENPARVIALPQTAAYAFTPASWIVNGRVALRDVGVGPAKVEVAWARNLFNNREVMFPLRLQNVYSGTFVPARTYGVDLTFTF